jgi:mono/diheme cytochrome c family protein
MFSPYMKLAYSIIFLANCGLIVQASGPVAFEDLKVIFKKHCLTCHNSERPRGGLDMTTKTAILAGSDSGISITAGKATESLLYRLAAHLEAPHMPPNSPKMPDRDLEQIKIWIDLFISLELP